MNLLQNLGITPSKPKAIHEVEEAVFFFEVQFQNKVFMGETNLPPKKKLPSGNLT